MAKTLLQSRTASSPAVSCPSCGSDAFWENLQLTVLCRNCCPPPTALIIRRKLQVIDGEWVDSTEREFRLRYPDETWDYFDHLTPEDLSYAKSSPDRSQCVWCGRFAGLHTPLCGKLHDDWEIRFEFGKHRGRKLREVPRDYLRYLLNWPKLHTEIRKEICRILGVPYLEPIIDDI